jgi:hypothetical protein
VVTQNGASTHLYQNVQGNPGLRVRLNAGPANPTGVGAIARLIFADEKKAPPKSSLLVPAIGHRIPPLSSSPDPLCQ